MRNPGQLPSIASMEAMEASKEVLVTCSTHPDDYMLFAFSNYNPFREALDALWWPAGESTLVRGRGKAVECLIGERFLCTGIRNVTPSAYNDPRFRVRYSLRCTFCKEPKVVVRQERISPILTAYTAAPGNPIRDNRISFITLRGLRGIVAS